MWAASTGSTKGSAYSVRKSSKVESRRVNHPSTLVRPDMKKTAAMPTRATSNSRSGGRARAAASPQRGYTAMRDDMHILFRSGPARRESRLGSERSHTVGRLELSAGAGLHELPGVSLVVDFGGACAGRAGASLTFVLAGQRDAVAFLHRRFGWVSGVC